MINAKGIFFPLHTSLSLCLGVLANKSSHRGRAAISKPVSQDVHLKLQISQYTTTPIPNPLFSSTETIKI